MTGSSRGRILLVDALPDELRSYARVLDDAGFEVTSALGGVDASHLVRAGRFDVVLSDISMPDMDGLALLRCIRKQDAELPVILMTKASEVPVQEGVLECLKKPIPAKALEHSLERAVRFRRQRRGRSLAGYRNRRGEEVEVASFTATDAKNEFGRVLEAANQQGIVVITRHDAPKVVVLSFEEFRALAGAGESKLDDLSGEFDALLAKMQTPVARKGMKAAFGARPARMGAAAGAAPRQRG